MIKRALLALPLLVGTVGCGSFLTTPEPADASSDADAAAANRSTFVYDGGAFDSPPITPPIDPSVWFGPANVEPPDVQWHNPFPNLVETIADPSAPSGGNVLRLSPGASLTRTYRGPDIERLRCTFDFFVEAAGPGAAGLARLEMSGNDGKEQVDLLFYPDKHVSATAGGPKNAFANAWGKIAVEMMPAEGRWEAAVLGAPVLSRSMAHDVRPAEEVRFLLVIAAGWVLRFDEVSCSYR